MTKTFSEDFMACEAAKVFAIPKMKTIFTNKNTLILRIDVLQKLAVPWGALFDWGAENEGRRPGKFLSLESLKCHFPDFGPGSFDRILMVRK